MAFTFNGSTQYLSVNSSPIGNSPAAMSMACWVNAAAQSRGIFLALGNSATATPFFSFESVTGGVFNATYRDDSGAIIAYGPTAVIFDSTWHHVCVTISGANIQIFFDGALNTTSAAIPTGAITLNRLAVGALLRTSAALHFNGAVAEAALWSSVLSASEVESLAKGFTPEQVAPQSLVFYAPLVREAIDTKGSLAITNNNSATVSAHPRVYA